MYLLTNGKIITEDQILEGYSLLIQDNIIKKIDKDENFNDCNVKRMNVNGSYISPGFVDVHSDYIENMASPRPTSMIDFNLSLRETEKVLLGAGITTMFHSLSFYGKDLFEVKLIRQEDNVRKLLEIVSKAHNEKHLIRNRLHARFEIDAMKDVDFIKDYIEQGKIHLLSFMDHTPGQGQYRNIEIYKKTLKGYRNDLTDDDIDNYITTSKKKEKVTLDIINSMVKMAKDHNISVASHDDDSLEKIELMNSIGATISEFPINIDVARKAKEVGMYTIVGAPNILIGKSHSGNLSAAEAINNNVADIICSDYYPAAILHAIFIMNEKYNKDLCEMFRLATINPAKAVNMDNEIGSIKEGKKADILVIDKLNNVPVITNVFVDGKLTSSINFRE